MEWAEVRSHPGGGGTYGGKACATGRAGQLLGVRISDSHCLAPFPHSSHIPAQPQVLSVPTSPGDCLGTAAVPLCWLLIDFLFTSL